MAGAGVWFGEGDEQNIHVQLPEPYQMNNAAGICAVLERVLVAGLCFHLKCWEDNGWMRVSNSNIWKATAAALRQWRAPIFFQWTKGHNGNEGNKGTDALAEKGAQANEDSATPADTEITHEFDVEAYQHIQSIRGIEEQQSAQNMVQQVLATVANINGSIRHKNALRPMREFLWKALQSTFKIEAFWEDECPEYRVQKSMEHILVECSITGQTTLGQRWILPIYRVTLGGTLIQIRKEDVDGPAMQLYQILVTEMVHMIWKIQCQPRIQRGDEDPMQWHTEDEIQNLWIDAMNKRLTVDQLLANRKKYGLRAMAKAKVLATWKGTLQDEKSLPEDWIDQGRILVSIVLIQQRLKGRH
ncbi:uncharacterized protein EV420DRAFT_1622013 [Desarmillaria tabescens]|uniref:RNase H type-1 domain-containing protein n=1 Tax=Armillaria tabescens TaxID=1929756 RepID=A0AA39K1I4_ARMTA|nr:uncharacterized protein EV420DRAFT_1622013 [Desarmillaria tabescens]KAK0450448.1 hypothetical protein EV420DRAFT_1622013 [Desarmillaria tabescens]